jgi:predicted ribosome quality control (RQC) complex YloA/Tae2 family protein
LNHGRYLRLSDKAKLIIGKNQYENEKLEGLAGPLDYVFSPGDDAAGASALGRGDFSQEETLRLAARLTARYFDAARTSKSVSVGVRHGGLTQTIVVEPFSDEDVKKYLI